MDKKKFHQSVMLDEVIRYFDPQPGQSYIDCTLGGAGHTEELLKKISPAGKLLGIDLDPKALKAANEATEAYRSQITIVKDNFKNLKKIADVSKFDKVDGILLDLGISSGELEDKERGFSFSSDDRLDMRFGPESELTAETIINKYKQEDLIEIFTGFGQERLAKPISKKIIEIRKNQAIQSPAELADMVSAVYKKYYRQTSKIHPATKVFQALRIAVNQELQNLIDVLPGATELLDKGGRLIVISYHSLEDKIVKDYFKQESRDCICPPELPECRCGHKKRLKIITKKPIVPGPAELAINPRARSAKLRVAEKI